MGSQSPNVSDQNLKRHLLFYKIILVVLVGVIVFLLLQSSRVRNFIANKPPAIKLESQLPHYDEIMQVIHRLGYSGLQAMVRPEVQLRIDFANKLWALTNIHRYDSEGNIVLDEGRYGLCGELSAYVSHGLKAILKNEYRVVYARVAEAGFFLRPQSSHTVLLFSKDPKSEIYLLDPAFGRYGKKDDFDDYLFFETMDKLPLLDQKIKDVVIGADNLTPILIKNNYLVLFSVGSVDGKFDKNNFELSISANHRYKFAGRYIFAIRKANGKTQEFQNKWMIEQMLSPQEFELLRAKIVGWFQAVSA